jgi:hypothetical protein
MLSHYILGCHDWVLLAVGSTYYGSSLALAFVGHELWYAHSMTRMNTRCTTSSPEQLYVLGLAMLRLNSIGRSVSRLAVSNVILFFSDSMRPPPQCENAAGVSKTKSIEPAPATLPAPISISCTDLDQPRQSHHTKRIVGTVHVGRFGRCWSQLLFGPT